MNKKSKKRLLNKKNKTVKKKRDNSCDKFCKSYYSPEIEKQFKKCHMEINLLLHQKKN